MTSLASNQQVLQSEKQGVFSRITQPHVCLCVDIVIRMIASYIFLSGDRVLVYQAAEDSRDLSRGFIVNSNPR